MKKLKVHELEEGMVLGAPIIDPTRIIELLAQGVSLNARHIQLIEGLGIETVYIMEAPNETKIEEDLDLDRIRAIAHQEGEFLDYESLIQDLREIENQVYPPAPRNVVNRNMEVNVITGEGNLPIDEKHERELTETQEAFQSLRETGTLDLDHLRSNVETMLPDMVRNNDVLMRLNQLKASDDYTFQHSLRVSILATMIGKWLGYSQSDLLDLAEAGLLYDIGKMKLPEYLLKKVDTISPSEYELIKKHPQLGYSVLLKLPGITNNIKYAALHHHERMDGSGYPLKLKSNQIHDFAKIIMVCDVFDAMITDRPYKKGICPLLAADYIIWSSGKLFDSEVCYVFVKRLSEFFLGKRVQLSNGEKGRIVYIDENFPTRPIVKVGEIFYDLIKDRSIDVAILS